jgi:hypothetical protein
MTCRTGASEVRDQMMAPGIGPSSKGVGSATPSGRALLGCCGSVDCVLPYWLRSRVVGAAAGCWRDSRECWCAYRRHLEKCRPWHQRFVHGNRRRRWRSTRYLLTWAHWPDSIDELRSIRHVNEVDLKTAVRLGEDPLFVSVQPLWQIKSNYAMRTFGEVAGTVRGDR